MNDLVWTTRDGREILIKDLDDQLLVSCIKYLKARGFVSMEDFGHYIHSAPQGDMAQMAFEQELLSRRPSLHLGAMEEEAQRRGLKV